MTDPSAWGVSGGFWDVGGEWHAAEPEAVRSALNAMGASAEQPPAPTMVTVRLDHQLPPIGHGRLVFEDGTELGVDGDVPTDLPSGYHLFYPEDGEPYPLVVSPGRVPCPERPMWGFSTQLYAARSRQSWGIGDLGDLRRLAQWSTSAGADLVVVNPLHACAPTLPQQPSPYYPGSRCFSNPIYLSVEDLPGAAWLDRGQLDGLARAGRALNSQRLIDRDEVWVLKSQALEALFADFRGSTAFNVFRSQRGQPLELFAVYCALAERHGSNWRTWAPGFRTPDGVAVERFAKSRAGAPRVTYYCWLQWLLSEQLRAAVAGTGLVQDLAVGIDPAGADSWIWQDTIAGEMRVGAPPDAFNTQGQDWGLPPFDPWKLRSAGYAPWIEALRAGFRYSRGLRIDHVMGLFRVYWIPPGAPPSAGVYVRYPHHDLLNILALEAERAGAFVVGEDLGTVEDHVRDDLAERAIMSSRVWWFEDKPPAEWPTAALGSVSTHDLPTVAGVVTGSDLEAQRRIGIAPDEAMSAGLHRRIEERTGADGALPVTDVIARVHADLAQAPCLVLTASLEDVLGLDERPNMPGTIDQWPNWRLALPVPIEELSSVALAKEIATILSRS